MAYTLVPTELIVDGAVTSAKLDTNISISGTLGVTGELTLATHMIMGDNDKIKIGTGGDLEIYHDGSNSYISNSTGNIYLADTNGSVHIQAKLNEESIVCAADGAVTLYHDNAVKLATISTGIKISGVANTDDTKIYMMEDSNNGAFIKYDGSTNEGELGGLTSSGENTVMTWSRSASEVVFNENSLDMDFRVESNDNTNMFNVDGGNNVVLVGKGSDAFATAGVVLATTQNSAFTRDSGNVLALRRNSNDGDLVTLYKDTAKIGSIASRGGTTASFITNTASGSGAGISGSTNMVIACDETGAANGSTVSLGSTSTQWKDLYLSGTANVGSVSSGSASSASEIIATSLDNGTSFGSNRMLKLVGTSTTDNSRMGIHFTGNTGIGNGLAIIEAVNEDQSAGHTSLRMHTYSGSWNENNLVLKSGSVGIGTNDPDSKLHVKTGTAQNDTHGLLKIEQTSTSSGSSATNAGITTKNHHGTSQFMQWEDHGLRIGSRILTNSGIGDVIFTAGSDSEKMRITSDGKVWIGSSNVTQLGSHFVVVDGSDVLGVYASTITAGVVLQTNKGGANGTDSTTTYLSMQRPDGTVRGTITATGTSGVVYGTTSDYRLKENVKTLENGLDRLKQLKPVEFNWIETKEKEEGFIAHEIQKVFPYAVNGKKDDEKMQSVDYGRITPLLVKAIQEQQTLIDDLKSRIETLENE